MGMAPLALLLLARAEGESYASAGVVVAAYGARARARHRSLPDGSSTAVGRGRVLLQRAIAYPPLLGLVIVLALLDAPLVAIGAAAVAAGAAIPPVSSTVRSVWPKLDPG